MKKVILTDCQGKFDEEGKPFGHYLETFINYYHVLKKDYEVEFFVDKNYVKYIKKFIDEDVKINVFKTKEQSFFLEYKKIYEIFAIKSDFIIFQSGLFWKILFLSYFKSNNTKILLIIYNDLLNRSKSYFKNFIKNKLYKFIKKNIYGLILSDELLSEKFNHQRTIVLPDYIKKPYMKENKKKYDVGVVGIITKNKDVLDIVNTFKNTNQQVIIAGKFKSNNLYNECIKHSTNNIKILNKYLKRNEYIKIIKSCKFIALPYLDKNFKSSGVFWDALYYNVPLIAKETSYLKKVNTLGLGINYKRTISEVKEEIREQKNYDNFVRNIKIYTQNKYKKSKDKLLELMKG